MKTYNVNEIFYSIQGEGVRAGTPAIFVRFSGCNRKCRKEPGPLSLGGFDCDTNHEPSIILTAKGILDRCLALTELCEWIVFTGGEPMLQLDDGLIKALSTRYRLAIETNGTIPVLDGIDWITVSPKVRNDELKQLTANEVKYVLSSGERQNNIIAAEHHVISPAFKGAEVDRDALEWCINLVLESRMWRLSVQQHKLWGVK